MNWLSTLLLSTSLATGADPVVTHAQPTPDLRVAPVVTEFSDQTWSGCACPERKPLESDHCFDRFIGPISNPILSKDPRSLTEARLLFIQNSIDPQSALGSGNAQVYACQVRAALTERLTFIADKDGYAVIHPGAGGTRDGWLDLAAGLKYAFVRDVENQLLVTGGFMYEIPSGEAEVFQHSGSGLFTFFGTVGKEFNENVHFLGTVGYQVPLDNNDNSSFYYTSLHLDRRIMDVWYPLIEMNWFHYVAGGNALPNAVGEGDGLLNLGTQGVSGNDLVTLAVGLKYKPGPHVETGAAWEVPISNRHDLLNNRLLAEFIIRY